ncbi:MAG: hypothetical protein JOZ40_18030 [Methylobacteriaceae bacterium]|nr:hypothetical protein [Methylobacteriaceae bacterium]
MQRKAAELGIRCAEYVRRLVARDLGKPGQSSDVSIIFDLVDGPPTDIAREKDKMVGEAVWKEHLRDKGLTKPGDRS